MGHMNDALARARHRLSAVDYHRMAEAGILRATDRVELIEGEIVDMAPIGSRHAFVVNRLAEHFTLAALGECLVSVQNPVRLDDQTEPQPDIALLKPGEYMNQLPDAADVLLIVEVADSSIDYDRSVKVELYARHGVCEVWLLDLGGVMLTIHRDLFDGAYRTVLRPAAGDELSPAALPGVRWALRRGKTWGVPF